jgi:hypothetical protein
MPSVEDLWATPQLDGSSTPVSMRNDYAASVGERMATLLPIENAFRSTCLSRSDFPTPAIPETSMTKSLDTRTCLQNPFRR